MCPHTRSHLVSLSCLLLLTASASAGPLAFLVYCLQLNALSKAPVAEDRTNTMTFATQKGKVDFILQLIVHHEGKSEQEPGDVI